MSIGTDALVGAVTDAAPAGFKLAMAYCRLASEQAARDRSSKPSKEAWCLSRNLIALLGDPSAVSPVNLVDLGCGNGEKAVQIVRALSANGIGPVSYFPVDLNPFSGLYAIVTVLCATGGMSEKTAAVLLGASPSSSFLDALSARPLPYETVIQEIYDGRPSRPAIRTANMIVPTRGLSVDFVADLPRLMRRLDEHPIYQPGIRVVSLLGQTFGNFTRGTRAALLRGLRRHMTPDDLLLIDGGLRPEEATTRPDGLARRTANLVDFYTLGECFMRHEADSEASIYRVAYNAPSHEIRYWFDRTDGSRQDLGFSYMWTVREFRRDIEAAGFDIVRGASSLEVSDLQSGPETIAVLARTGQTP